MATYFIPLTFAASVFGMGFEVFGQGDLPMAIFCSCTALGVLDTCHVHSRHGSVEAVCQCTAYGSPQGGRPIEDGREEFLMIKPTQGPMYSKTTMIGTCIRYALLRLMAS